jgi:hypothetical protein
MLKYSIIGEMGWGGVDWIDLTLDKERGDLS